MDKVRMGVIGLGGMGAFHAGYLRELEHVELTCVCDAFPAVAEAKGKELGVRWFSDYQELAASGLADAVLVATPHWFHAAIARTALEHGLHVLSEKPPSVTVGEADLALRAAQRKKRLYAVMYQKRTEPNVRRALEIIRGGQIGEVRRTLCIHPWFRSQAYYNSSPWRATWKGEGGGVLINQAPHDIDLFMLLGGLPSWLEARTRTRMHDIEVEDEVDAVVEYANGAWGYFYTSTCEAGDVLTIEVAGERGKVTLRGNELIVERYSQPLTEFSRATAEVWAQIEVKEERFTQKPEDAGVPQNVVRNFVNAILSGEPLISPAVEAVWSVEFINALIMSGKKRRPVSIPVSRKRYATLMEELKASSVPKKVVLEQRVTDPKFFRK